jgi:hypothetical protein
MRCIDVSVYRIKILNFKLKMTDSNRSIYSPYQTFVKNQILYSLNFFCYFFGRKKIIAIGRFKFLKSRNFLLTQKNSNFFLKNIKFNFLQEFDMKNKLNGLDRLFLT